MVFLLHVCDINYSLHKKNVTCQILKYGIQSLFTVWRTHSQTSFLVGEKQIRISILSQSLKLLFFSAMHIESDLQGTCINLYFSTFAYFGA